MSSQSLDALFSDLGLPPEIVAGFIAILPTLVGRRRTEHELNRELLEDLHLSPLLDVPNTPQHQNLSSDPSSPLQSISNLEAVRMLFCNPTQFRQMTMLTITEFFLLHDALHESIASVRPEHDAPHPHSHPMPTRLNTIEQLLLWIVYLEEVGVKGISWVFGLLPTNTLHRYVDHVTRCVNSALQDELRWPSAELRECLYGYFSICDTAVAVLDGTHCEIEEPTYDSRRYYSGYKHMTSQNYLVHVNVLGIVLKVEGPFPGRRNDRADYNVSEVAQHPEQFLSPGERILADGGFVGGHPLLVPIHSTIIQKETDKKRKAMMLEINEELKDNRLMVEDVFSWLKARAKRLDFRYGRERGRQSEEFFAACSLHNFVRRERIKVALCKPKA